MFTHQRDNLIYFTIPSMSESHAVDFLASEPWIKSLKEVDNALTREFLGVANTDHFHNHVRTVNHDSTLYIDGSPYEESLFICIQSLAWRGSEEKERMLFEMLAKSAFFKDGNFKATKDHLVFFPQTDTLESKTTAWEERKKMQDHKIALDKQRKSMDKQRKEMIAQLERKHEIQVRALREEMASRTKAHEEATREREARAAVLESLQEEMASRAKAHEEATREHEEARAALESEVAALETRIRHVKESSKTARTFYKKLKKKGVPEDVESIVAALDVYNSIDVKVMVEAMEFWKNVDDDVDWCLLKTLLDEHKSNKTMSYHEVENKMYKKVFSYLIKRFQREDWAETCEKYTALINERELSTTDIDNLLDMVSTHLWLVPPSKKAEDPMVAFRDQLAYRNTFHWKLEEWSRKSNWGVDSLLNMLTTASEKNDMPISIEFGAASTIITMCVPVDMLAWEFLYHAQKLTEQPVSFLLNRSNGKAIEPAQLMVCFPKVRML